MSGTLSENLVAQISLIPTLSRPSILKATVIGIYRSSHVWRLGPLAFTQTRYNKLLRFCADFKFDVSHTS